MKGISSKGHYALQAMYILSRSPNLKPMQVKQIAALIDVSPPYLEQIMSKLKKAGFLKSMRGAAGGFEFGKDPSQITVFEIVDTVEPTLFTIKQKNQESSVLHHFWEDMTSRIKEQLSVKLSDLDQRYQPFIYEI